MILRLFIFLVIFPLNIQAMEMVGAMSASLGGTGRTAIQSNESLYLNPATIALMDHFYSGASYHSGFTGDDVHRNTYSFSLSDGTKGTLLPGSFGYRRHKINDKGAELTENEFKLGFGYRLSPRVSMGVGFSHLDADHHALKEKYKQTNGDLGFLLGLRPNWGVSLNGENLIKTENRVPEALRRRSLAALGTQYIYQSFITLRYEALLPIYNEKTTRFGHRFGTGFNLQSDFVLNLGFSNDDYLGENWYSAGLAWLGPRLRIAYSFQNEERRGLGQRHLVDFWVDI